MSYIGPLTKDLIETCAKELKKKENKDKIIANVFDPIINEIFSRYLSYISCFMFVHLITIILLIYIIYNLKK